tara:strand:- start:34 stop:192 length:159 start_codon:yes stop_codon:yes gene_type:complete
LFFVLFSVFSVKFDAIAPQDLGVGQKWTQRSSVTDLLVKGFNFSELVDRLSM